MLLRWLALDLFPKLYGATTQNVVCCNTHSICDMPQHVQSLTFPLAFIHRLYGASVQSVISLNTQGTWGVVVKVLLCLVISLSYPLQFLPVSQILEMLAEGDFFSRLYLKMPSR